MRQFLFLVVTMCSIPTIGQTYRFNQYTMEDGISQDFIYSIDQDENGYLWAGTGEGLCRFDGQNFVTYTTRDGLAEDFISCSFVGEEGDLWFGHNEGGVTRLTNGRFVSYKDEAVSTSTVTGICGKAGKVIWVTQNEGMFTLKDGAVTFIDDFGTSGFYNVVCIDKDNVLIGTSAGLLHVSQKGGAWAVAGRYHEDMWISDLSETHDDGIFLMAMNPGGVYKVRMKGEAIEFSGWDGKFKIDELPIRTVIEDVNRNIWLGTFGQGLIKIHTDSVGEAVGERTIYNEQTGLSYNFVEAVFQDREGNIWIGTNGRGLSTLIDDFFTFYAHDPETGFGNSVNAVWVGEDDLWYGVENGLIRINPNDEVPFRFYNDSTGFVDDMVTALLLVDSTMWIGTSSNGIFRMNTTTNTITPVKWNHGGLANSVNQIVSDGDILWVATDGGVVVYNPSTGSVSLMNTSTGLAHNSINSVYLDRDGAIWMGTHSRYLYVINGAEIEQYEITNAGQIDVVSITQDLDGFIWIATAESGVYKHLGSTFKNYSMEDGLWSNYCYSIHADVGGNMWVGHRGGLSKIDRKGERISTYSDKSGVEDWANPNAMFLDAKGYLWIGTDGGAIKYDPTKDHNNVVPPVVNILKVIIGEEEFSASQDIILPYGDYRIQFEYIGVSFSNPDLVTYQFQLEGYDDVYSDVTQAVTATYGKISDGEYVFKVIACNEDGECNIQPATIRISIAAPIWKKWWFYLILFFIIAGAVIGGVRYRLNRLKAVQAYLQKELDIKTKEVVDKAQVIEEINKDMTDSINYAQRIQNAILPEHEVLQSALPGSFIFFKPKDIVSGDFYFVQKVNNKLIVACVDCTGHGVPGAFMSMIGSVTLRNIYATSQFVWQTPEMVLEQLDVEIKTILNQKASVDISSDEAFFQSRDGMDLSLCEIDLDTNTVKLASAMRTSLIYRSGELEVISGDRRAIGGGEEVRLQFTVKEFKMEKGDALYLFSDGYTDQFGGADGRKLKISGTRKIIESLSELPADQHLASVESNFELWQAEWPQIDDVLMIGLRF